MQRLKSLAAAAEAEIEVRPRGLYLGQPRHDTLADLGRALLYLGEDCFLEILHLLKTVYIILHAKIKLQFLARLTL